MKCLQVFQSIASWRRLSGILMKPKVALKILRYTKLVEAEWVNIEKLRVALAYDVSGTPENAEVKIEPDSPQAVEFGERFSDILNEESELARVSLTLDEVVHSLEGKEDSLTVSDLALLEPFFFDSADEFDNLRNVQPDGDCSE